VSEWLLNAKRKVRTHTWCDGSSDKEDADRCYHDSLIDASTTDCGVWQRHRTHESSSQHGSKHDFILIPEGVCSENEKT
jgi:hypothetical protein